MRGNASDGVHKGIASVADGCGADDLEQLVAASDAVVVGGVDCMCKEQVEVAADDLKMSERSHSEEIPGYLDVGVGLIYSQLNDILSTKPQLTNK